jgi:hypothetical protein
MFEEIDIHGYTVVYGDGIQGNDEYLLEKYLKKYHKLLVIADKVQKSGSAKSLFKVFNNFSGHHDNIRFLFAARKRQLDTVIEGDPDLNRSFTDCLNNMEDHLRRSFRASQ